MAEKDMDYRVSALMRCAMEHREKSLLAVEAVIRKSGLGARSVSCETVVDGLEVRSDFASGPSRASAVSTIPYYVQDVLPENGMIARGFELPRWAFRIAEMEAQLSHG